MSMNWEGGKGVSAGVGASAKPVPDVPLRRERDKEAFERFMAAWEAEVLERIKARTGRTDK